MPVARWLSLIVVRSEGCGRACPAKASIGTFVVLPLTLRQARSMIVFHSTLMPRCRPKHDTIAGATAELQGVTASHACLPELCWVAPANLSVIGRLTVVTRLAKAAFASDVTSRRCNQTERLTGAAQPVHLTGTVHKIVRWCACQSCAGLPQLTSQSSGGSLWSQGLPRLCSC